LETWVGDTQRAFHIFERKLRKMCSLVLEAEEGCELFKLSDGRPEMVSRVCKDAVGMSSARRSQVAKELATIAHLSSESKNMLPSNPPLSHGRLQAVGLSECRKAHDSMEQW